MKTAVVLVMVILLVSGLANAAPTEASGVIVSEEAVQAFRHMRIDYLEESFGLILHIKDGVVQVKLALVFEPEDKFNEYNMEYEKQRYKEFWRLGPAPEKCLYLIYNFPYLEQQEGDEASRKKHAFVFIGWIPDEAPVKEMTLYSSCKDKVKRALYHGFTLDTTVSELDEITFSRIQEQVLAAHVHK